MFSVHTNLPQADKSTILRETAEAVIDYLIPDRGSRAQVKWMYSLSNDLYKAYAAHYFNKPLIAVTPDDRALAKLAAYRKLYGTDSDEARAIEEEINGPQEKR